MIYTNKVNTKKQQPICSSCSPFIIEGPTELPAKLAALENELNVRKKSPASHAEFVSIVQGLVFVVLAQPISTHCIIVDDIVAKATGVAAKHKAKADQGDFQ